MTLHFSAEQIQAMGPTPEQRVMLAVQYLVQQMPDRVRGIPVHLLFSQVDAGFERARRHGLSDDIQLFEFVAVMHEIAPNFDQEPTLAGRLRGGPGTPQQRWDSLFEGLPELEWAWERAAQPSFYDPRAWIEGGPKV